MKQSTPSKRQRLPQTLIFAAGLLISLQAYAESEEDAMFLMLSGDEELISIATGTPRPVSKAPAVASVITAEQIRASGDNTLAEVLERVPGLHIIPSSANHMLPTYSFRGINTGQGAQTLFLINGQEITLLQSGGLALSFQFSLNNIKRIEIIRGPGSAVYGADAFAGVINIITKSDTDIDGLQMGVKAGSFDTKSIWGQYGGEFSGWHIAANLEYKKTAGDSTRIIDSDLQSVFDDLFGSNASLAPGPVDSAYNYFMSNFTLSKEKWTLHLNSWDANTGLGTGISNALDSNGAPLSIEMYQFDVAYNDRNWLESWSLELRLSHLYSDSYSSLDVFPDGANLPIGADGNLNLTSPVGLVSFPDGYIGIPGRVENTSRFDITSYFNGWQTQRWRFNAGIKKEGFKSSESKNFGPGVISGSVSPINGSLTDVTGTEFVYLPNQNRSVIFLSIQDEWTFAPDWQLIIGIRYDEYSDVGSTTNPRLSLIWNTRYDLTSKLLYGRAFRPPSFTELYIQNNPVTIGNPLLKPEVINTLELAFDYKPLDTLSLIFNVFYYEIDGLIDIVDNDGIFGGDATAQNTIDQKASGFELEARWQATRSIRFFGSSAFQNAENMDTGDNVADAPRKQLHLGANWRHTVQWSSQLDSYAIMQRPRNSALIPPDNRKPVDDYNWVNISIIGQQLINKISVKFTLRNLFNTDAREPGPPAIPNDYPLEGRSAYIEVWSKF